MPRVLEAIEGRQSIFVPEGEKDVDALEGLGLYATCNPMGAGKWRDEHSRMLIGAGDVNVVRDRDDAGHKHARQVVESLRSVAGIDATLVEPREGKDVSEHLAAGRSWMELAEVEPGASQPEAPLVEPEPPPTRSWAAAIDGAAFALDAPEQVPAVWGAGEEVAWAEGEPLGIVGPQGVGKTTLTHQLLRGLVGRQPSVLGLPVTEVSGKVLLLALDRPAQAARALRRVVSEDDREILRERLIVWRGRLPFDLLADPGALARMAVELEAGAVLLDAAKDTGLRLSTDDGGGGAFNEALQALVEAGVQVAFDHHQRKPTSDNRKPRTLSDVYGSTWVTAGCGSVLLAWGEPGDPVIELSHLKQPADAIGPLSVVYDHRRGTARLDEGGHLRMIDVVREQASAVSVRDAAIGFYGIAEPDRNTVEKARRKLEALVEDGLLSRTDRATKFGSVATYTEADK
jgi:replicative DNA helicase